ncbi:MAG: DUF6782 family putative metallopeptidase [Acidimicrobiales bacterium]
MTDVRCAQCSEVFQAQAWTRECPRCGAQKAGRCDKCGIPVDLAARTCNLHSALAAGAPGGPSTDTRLDALVSRAFGGPATDTLANTAVGGPSIDAPPYERPSWPPATTPVGDLIPEPRPRRRRWPLAVLAVVLLGAATGGGLVAFTMLTDKPYPSTWDPRVKELAAFVEKERGLEFDHPVYVDFLSDAQFRREATQHEDLTPDEEAEVERGEAMLRAVGLLHGDVDLEQIGEELVGDGTVGQYRFEDQRIAVRGETLDDERRATLVHELTHALQDQNFKIGDYEAADSGGDLAFTAVVEADADNVEAAWGETLSDDAREALFKAQDETSGSADFEGVPPVFIELMGFPYAFGPGLLDAVISRKGQAGRNDLFAHPPLSEEHVVLPDTYLDDQAVTKVKTPKLAAGEKVIRGSQSDFGMVSLLVVLGERLDYEVAWKAVQGWAGDSSIGFERGDKTCVRIDVAFDEAPQAERFEAAVDQWSKNFPASHSRKDRTVRVESCDPGTAAPGGRAEGHVSGIQGLGLRAGVQTQLADGDWPEDKRACVADHIIEELTADGFIELDQELQENPTKAAVARAQAATDKAAEVCGA